MFYVNKFVHKFQLKLEKIIVFIYLSFPLHENSFYTLTRKKKRTKKTLQAKHSTFILYFIKQVMFV